MPSIRCCSVRGKGWGMEGHEFQTGRAVRQNLHTATRMGAGEYGGPGLGPKSASSVRPRCGDCCWVCVVIPEGRHGRSIDVSRGESGRGRVVGRQDMSPPSRRGPRSFARRQREKGRGRDGTTLERPGQDRTAGASCIVMTHLVSDGRCRNTNRTKRFVGLVVRVENSGPARG